MEDNCPNFFKINLKFICCYLFKNETTSLTQNKYLHYNKLTENKVDIVTYSQNGLQETKP